MLKKSFSSSSFRRAVDRVRFLINRNRYSRIYFYDYTRYPAGRNSYSASCAQIQVDVKRWRSCADTNY